MKAAGTKEQRLFVRPSDARTANRRSALRLDALRPKEMTPKAPIQMCEQVCLFCNRECRAGFPGGRRVQTPARLRTYWFGERNLLSFLQASYVRAAIA